MYIKWNFIICFAQHYFHPLPQHSWGYLSFSFTFCLYLLSCLRSPGYRLIYRSRNSWRKSLCNRVPRKILRASSAPLPFPTCRSWVGTRALLLHHTWGWSSPMEVSARDLSCCRIKRTAVGPVPVTGFCRVQLLIPALMFFRPHLLRFPETSREWGRYALASQPPDFDSDVSC